MAGIRRSLHFVPGTNERMLSRALTTAADALLLDLEDAVMPARKEEARGVVGDAPETPSDVSPSAKANRPDWGGSRISCRLPSGQ